MSRTHWKMLWTPTGERPLNENGNVPLETVIHRVDIETHLENAVKDPKLYSVQRNPYYTKLKGRILTVDLLLREDNHLDHKQRQDLIRSILEHGLTTTSQRTTTKPISSYFSFLVPRGLIYMFSASFNAQIQQEECRKQIKREVDTEKQRKQDQSRVELLKALKATLVNPQARTTLVIEKLDIMTSPGWNTCTSYSVVEREEKYSEPALRKIHHDAVLYIHLLNDVANNCLLITRGHLEGLKRDKIGEHFLLAFDETKRMLAVCGHSPREPRLQLHTFAFDEKYTSLQGLGGAINLGLWYEEVASIKHMIFVCGTEELLLVDDNGRGRIFSLMTQQFRPASLQLQRMPSALFSSPDGSCFLAMEEFDNVLLLRAYHWSSFGSSGGIELDLSMIHIPDGQVISSFLTRNIIHFLGLDVEDHCCRSVALNITQKNTEFTFKEKGGSSAYEKNHTTAHNCIIDCHADVWTRFPVVPAIRRETLMSSASRRPRSLTFVSSANGQAFAPHFKSLIDDFKRATRKPVGGELSSILIFTSDQESFLSKTNWSSFSRFPAGEWLVELLCLIPIHIAVTRDNRFIPLKDGVWSSDLERSLLGADVGKIVDSLSFGWYESLFRSYMATKPVKVVSSMGEQSVGKSFALNHLVDTSFAGSAMRTTEGVWMSVTPTRDALIVALDFEGVHSIERSAQEDTLLVLFNTAISNLVLFRNNFALSRDITGLFQSFQSSASVLDPEANPSLFQSTLVIIIKDVIDSDKIEIKKEFSLKFQQIVQAEQGSNFITCLHRNRLDIIPWPVIESKQFYTLFNTLKKRLDQQPTTHLGGAVFLQTLKTLMAKLKVNDWGALSQNLASHRAQLLLSLLPAAIAFGATEIAPDFEPLKDFDTDILIDKPDTPFHLYLEDNGPPAQPASPEMALDQLRSSWDLYRTCSQDSDKTWVEQLQMFLNHVVDLRVDHVREWLSANTSKFLINHADIQSLWRRFDGVVIDLKASVQLCTLECAECHLACVRGRHHGGSHDCQTSHHCSRFCQFEDAEHDADEPCGLLAGHPGSHTCDIAAHLCGQHCALAGKKGCLELCTKLVDHEDNEHMCSATVHECGMPCSLVQIRLPNGLIYSCREACRVPSHEAHYEHQCGNRQCPIPLHLCGQEHACSALCAAQGICQIETTPQSVEATFTGRHETFQYTKYNQVSKRLQCVVPIPAGRDAHDGWHIHTLDPDPFHFCEMRCEDCGYFCTLPLGHTQQEHDTRHGSMSKTRWTIDGPDGTILELDGRKFGSNDDGAPMLCSLYCRSMGRHLHVDYCQADSAAACNTAEVQHIRTPMEPNRTARRIGSLIACIGEVQVEPHQYYAFIVYFFRLQRSILTEDQAEFAKCDAMCGGSEHNATQRGPAQPSFCTLPILHPRQTLDQTPSAGLGYISDDGHVFQCKNPAMMQQAFHVIFVIDKSSSMAYSDRRPWIIHPHPVRFARGTTTGLVPSTRLFSTAIAHDFTSAPQDLLDIALRTETGRGTDFGLALRAAQACMEQHWSTQRTPVIIFLSDGEGKVASETVQDLCRRSTALGKPVSLQTVAFGPRSGTLRQMAQIARDIESQAPQDPLNPHAVIQSNYTEALDTVQLAQTFLGIADSLMKTRGSLFRG
ncbi:hypothetical protein A0H81_03826 [Grifola frondosa]|uniref:VWFA domain-containing protein n=1 Tax=Grifola frondosa TaxID=5627 RepID=A0A1C7MJS8_GRIFR|nr:hypothetical protein A0H81_03826 [Grifola frondosa]